MITLEFDKEQISVCPNCGGETPLIYLLNDSGPHIKICKFCLYTLVMQIFPELER